MTAALHLVALVPRAAAVPGDAPEHRRIRWGRFDAVVIDGHAQDLASADSDLAQEAALRHAWLAAAYAAETDVVPVAPGAVFSSRAALLDHFESGAEAWRARADAVAGRVEYIVCAAALPPASAAAPGSAPAAGGSAFLHRKRGERDRRIWAAEGRRDAVKRLAAALSEMAAEVSPLEPGAPDRLARFAVCLERGAVESALAALAHFAEAHRAAGLRLTLVGPCPPHAGRAP